MCGLCGGEGRRSIGHGLARQSRQLLSKGIDFLAESKDRIVGVRFDLFAVLLLQFDLVLIARIDLALELKLVDGLQVSRASGLQCRLTAVPSDEERSDKCRPQRGEGSDPQPQLRIGKEHDDGGDDSEYQKHAQADLPRVDRRAAALTLGSGRFGCVIAYHSPQDTPSNTVQLKGLCRMLSITSVTTDV